MLTGGSRRWFRLPAIPLAIKGALKKSQTDCGLNSTCGGDWRSLLGIGVGSVTSVFHRRWIPSRRWAEVIWGTWIRVFASRWLSNVSPHGQRIREFGFWVARVPTMARRRDQAIRGSAPRHFISPSPSARRPPITSRSRRTISRSHRSRIFGRSDPPHFEPYGVGAMRKLLWGHRASKTAVLSAPLAGHHFGDSEHSSTALRPFFLPPQATEQLSTHTLPVAFNPSSSAARILRAWP